MKLLQEKILKYGANKQGTSLNVDRFLNHMAEPELLLSIADFFAEQFSGETVTKVLTVEAGGIALATMTAFRLHAKSVYALKSRKDREKSVYRAAVSGTEQLFLTLPRSFLNSTDTVLIVDDFLGTGNATKALVEIVAASGARLAGVGIAIERKYLGGGDMLRLREIPVVAATTVLSQSSSGIVFKED